MRGEQTVAVVGGGIVGCAMAMELARRGRRVTLLEAEPAVALAASGTNSGIVHTGFDSKPGELETALIVRAGPLRDAAIAALDIPVWRCGAVMGGAPPALADNAAANGVPTRWDGPDLRVPGEGVTDPVAMATAFAAEARRHGAQLSFGARVTDTLAGFTDVVNCAGLHADDVARIFGDDSFAIRPRKGEFLVYRHDALREILLPVPSPTTKGVIVFPTLDGHTSCGPTAVDLEDKEDWTVREAARETLQAAAGAALPDLAGLRPVFAYAGLRPAGVDGVNYVVGRSAYAPRLVNVAAIRSTGLTAALGIADHVCQDILEIDEPPAPYIGGAAEKATSWWRRTAAHRAA